MSRIEGLVAEIVDVFGEKTSFISAVYFIKRRFYLFGGALGLIMGLPLRDFFFFLLAGGLTSLAVYASAEHYLFKIDHIFFSSSGRSKREIFGKYYANEIGRGLSLRMTEPENLVGSEGRAIEETRSLFQQRLAVELDREFKRSDWRYFVAACLYCQK
ncbi:hypothetical protein [Niveibacterium sp. SC-1]|uniref:hypothetical protein n=1 Tax=Niveibacterium sp. SC-1 TaxID=3135646 RepID=UPI00311F14E5